MDLELVLNELSLDPPATSTVVARTMMKELVLTMKASVRLGATRVLRCYSDLNCVYLAPNYLFAQWRNDGSVDLEERRYMSSITTKSPLLKDVIDPQLMQAITLSDCKCNGVIAAGLAFAFHTENIGISFNTHSRWQRSEVEIEVERMREDGEIELLEAAVRHASFQSHVTQHAAWIRHRLSLPIKTGGDIWNNKDSLFPALSFCSVVKDQLLNLESIMLKPTVKRLFELNCFAATWDGGYFNPDKIPSKASPESAATLDMYKDERTFVCPDGRARLFSWHVRLTPGAWRLHFFPEQGPGNFIIGYLGPKLPSVDYPT